MNDMMLTYLYKAGFFSLIYDMFEPDRIKFPGPRPAVVFFFGGGFVGGSREQFYPQARALADLGYVVLCPEYRVRSRHNASPLDCITDGIRFYRHILDNAEKLKIDVDRVALSGDSAGAAVAVFASFNLKHKPQCFVLFNPAIVRPSENCEKELKNTMENLGRLYPLPAVRPDMPPMLILHGEADDLFPVDSIAAYGERSRALGNFCRIITYPDQKHGFFNPGASKIHYELTLKEMIVFLYEMMR